MAIAPTGLSGTALTVGGASSSARSESARSNSQVDYDTYLTLLVAQMKHQDPLSPTDSTEWVAQLATFSQVEQAIESNAQLGEILTLLQLDRSEALIGRTLTSADGSVSGLVTGVQVGSDGIVAQLDDGRRLIVGNDTIVT